MYEGIVAGIIAGAISKFLDDREFDSVAKILILISLPVWYIYLSHFFLIGIAIILGVYLAQKIDTHTLSWYFGIVVVALVLSVIFSNPEFRLFPFMIYLVAIYYDEQNIKIFGLERVSIYLGWGFMMLLSIGMYLGGMDVSLENYIRDIVGMIVFDIGYIVTARIIDK
ncbi:MAG: hypothetical protein N3C61_00580 [Candidatus Micrarchaeota archaeon]|nr:hypothetical protein [Candidatus Micrarchaeota archaeon]